MNVNIESARRKDGSIDLEKCYELVYGSPSLNLFLKEVGRLIPITSTEVAVLAIVYANAIFEISVELNRKLNVSDQYQ